MKRIHTNIVIGLMATGILLAAGCKREYGTVTLGADIDNGRDAKVYIDDLTPCWHNNDLIRVNSQTCTTSAALGSTAQITDVVENSHYRAIYPADIVGDLNISTGNTVAVTLPRVQQYETDSRGDQKVKVPMGAYSSNERLTFHNLCSLIKVVVSNRMENDFVLDSIVVTTSSAYLSGLGSATVAGRASDAVEMMVPSSASHSVSLAFAAAERPTIGRGDRDTYVYYIIAPEFTEDDVTITLHSQERYTVLEKSGVTLRHNRIAVVNLTVEEWDGLDLTNGALPGLFSVSATKQVHFSKGNLQYQASTGIWRFAEHQYDYFSNDNENDNFNYGWLDHFGWGTGNNPTFTLEDRYGYYYQTFNDWGYNEISNGGNSVFRWHTLTNSEWNYLLNIRSSASNKRGTGNINGVGGLIILPDSWTLPSGCSFIAGFGEDELDWTHNSYSLVQWANMEAAGAVFLPAAGFIGSDDEFVTEVGISGKYWSSTPFVDDEEIRNILAYSMEFYGSILSASNPDFRYFRFSVRLVRR